MVQPSAENVALASELAELLAGSGLLPIYARLYSHHTKLRENQSGGLMSWSETEARMRLDDVMRLLEAASVQRQTENPQWQQTVRRAGEILEWLPSTDFNSEEISTRLLAAACYQLASYPARALGLLRIEVESQGNESRVLTSLLKADFVGLFQRLNDYWSQTLTNVQSTHGTNNSSIEYTTHEAIVKETISALGLLCGVMRWGYDPRIQKALDKLTAVSKVVLHGKNPYSWVLSKLCAEVAATYVENNMRQHLEVLLQGVSQSGRDVFERYLRQGFQSGRSIAWPSQIRGIGELIGRQSFALCTPTGSGKTTVAELAILQSLFLIGDESDQRSSSAPLVIYLVPSRALATEVEGRLARVLRQTSTGNQHVTVTGLYGGTDWGPTDAWLTADERTVLICTYEKAEALMKFLGSFFLPRTSLIVVDEAHTVQFNGAKSSLQKSENRALRLESLGARLFSYLHEYRCRIVALSAVAAEAEGALARWISHNSDAVPVKTLYKSTRQLVGRLECMPARGFEIRYDLLDNAPLEFRSEGGGDSPYVPNPFRAYPQVPSRAQNGFVPWVRPYLFWAAMHLAAPDDKGQQRAVLISISEKISDYAKDFLGILNSAWSTVQLPNFFREPSDPIKQEIWQRCLQSCADYYTTSSREYKLLTKGIVVHHGRMPGLMARLLVDVIDEKIINLVMATSTLSEGVNLPFETVLIPSLQRWDVIQNSQVNLSSSEFNNLAGRAGRPGFATEGRTLVLLPEQPRDRAERSIREHYVSLVNSVQNQRVNTNNGAVSPLAELINHLRAQWSSLVPNGNDTEFLRWLEETAPINIEPDSESEENAIESLDALDNVLLAAIVEIEQMSAREMEPNELEEKLRRIWRQTYAYYASQRQAELQELFVRRGKALKISIYTNYTERRQLYKTSLPPRSGIQLLRHYRTIRDHLETGGNYLSRQEADKFAYIRDTAQHLSQVRHFRLNNVKGRGRGAETSWEVILCWWLCHQRADRQPKETQISDWHKNTNDNFYYRFNWGLGSILALAIDEAFGEGALEPTSLENWPRIGLPWIVFWMKELIAWGTLDPVAAYLLARVDRVITRTQAEGEQRDFVRCCNLGRI
ncbi:DEAD/DEAH box helicase [uncultured Nostoc sp.]|uniref:DEAD/DEAH box helicase n=1 Tax=uncultured Nostoc sp. TaxID=340711 RepID=UPI00261B4396|nr:DEAD/DEAH box helicase [uncultured Nostoc sp.]